jgi:hypothetical protein
MMWMGLDAVEPSDNRISDVLGVLDHRPMRGSLHLVQIRDRAVLLDTIGLLLLLLLLDL